MARKTLLRSFYSLLFFFLLWSSPLASPAAETEHLDSLLKEGEEHLEAWRLPQAEEALSRVIREDAKSLRALDLKAQVAFYQGRYEEAFRSLEEALAIESANEERQVFRVFTQRTIDAVKGLRRYESEHFILHLDEDRDEILVPLVLDALERTYRAIGEELGYLPQAKVRVEIAPDVPSFNAISTLSLRDIEETGAVGICKFNKIMAISPRTLVHGYRWLDSLSHEYLHYAIVGLSGNKAPIWLHEGMARFYETRWRRLGRPKDGPDYLTPSSQTLLAQALDRDELVAFEKMEPSLIYLETPQEVQLAYAEAASAIDFIINRKGRAGVRELLSELRETPTPEAIEKVMKIPFDLFETQWKGFLKGKGLKEIEGSRVRKLKVKGNQKKEQETVELKEIQSVVARNRTHLGDRLLARGRAVAAAAEYRRALKVSPHSTIILNRLGRVLIAKKGYEEALPYLKKARDLDPDYVGTYVQLGRLYHATENYPSAKIALEEAIQINPFDPSIHHLLYQTHSALGDADRAEESKATLKKLIGQR